VLDADATVALLTEAPARTVVLADFDGSLSAIVPDPPGARPLAGVVDALAALVPHYRRVGIVSGRPVDFLVEQLPVDGLVLVGQYGLERWEAGAIVVDPRAVPYRDAIAAVADEAEVRLPGIYVERKGTTAVTLHWRADADRADEVLAVAAELGVRHGLDAPQRGRKAVELRPPVPVDKGVAVAELVADAATGAFAGDDAGDLPAFAALDAAAREGRLEHAVRIGVLSPEAPPALRDAVDLAVDGPEGLLALLQAVVARVGRGS
jgi:trehalose 6-phosphate phosphatase